jgi:serine beta-lactamase-like protein LACTB
MYSSAVDLTKFGNAVLSSYQNSDPANCRTLLLPSTVKTMWEPAKGVRCYWSKTGGYGMGWQTEPYNKETPIKDLKQRFFVGHTGGTVGASSILWILPTAEKSSVNGKPKGVVVAIISNLNVNVRDAATDIAELFENC